MEEEENKILTREEELEEELYNQKKSMRRRYIFIIILVAVIVAVLSSEFSMNYIFNTYYKSLFDVSEANSDASKNIDSISEDLKSLRTLIDSQYIGDIDENKIKDETIKGYINGLGDEYSEYMTKDEWEDFQAEALGTFVGIGIYMSVNSDGYVVVLQPIEGTPAEEAGLKQGDIIYEVNDEVVLGESADDISSKIKGEEGTNVKITVYRDGEYLDFDITRKSIKVYHTYDEMLDNNIGYVRLVTFDDGCAEELKNSIETLQNQGATKIILDLRNNTGGIVDESLAIADYFIDKGQTTLVTVDASGNKEYSKSENDPIFNFDMVVLVNEYTASASEILTGCLKDYQKATVVGTQTYGKGVIQSVYGLSNGGVLKLTVDEYFTPNENKINKVGITPDEVVELDETTEDDEQLNKAIEILNAK